MSSKKVLIIEDDLSILKLLEYTLKKAFIVFTAQNGEIGLDTIKKEKPDIIISDIMMPKLTGIELKNIINKIEGLKDIPFIFLTADLSAKEKIKNSEIIIKPVSPLFIKQRIHNILS